jgi:hypothetical protein
MPRKATTALAVLLVFGTASVVLADTNDRNDDHGSLAQRPVSMMSNGRTGALNDAAKPFTTDNNASFAAVYIVGGLNRDRDSPELKEYLTEFQKRAGYAGENVGASVYSAVRLMCDAITRAGALEPAKGVRIRAYLKRAVAPASYLQP